MQKEKFIKSVHNIIEDMNAEQDEKTFFVVQVKISDSNKINVYVDAFEGITIGECKKISRAILTEYDRDVEDYELEVSSAGLDKPFLVNEQYQKNIGREIKIETKENKRIKGIIKKVSSEGIELEETRKEKGKKKGTQIINHELTFEHIQTAKVVISFK